jgi:hypothetical protein
MDTIIFGAAGFLSLILLAVLTSFYNENKREKNGRKNKPVHPKADSSFRMGTNSNTPSL